MRLWEQIDVRAVHVVEIIGVVHFTFCCYLPQAGLAVSDHGRSPIKKKSGDLDHDEARPRR